MNYYNSVIQSLNASVPKKIAWELFKMQMPKSCFPEVLEEGQDCACLTTHHGDFDVGVPESDFENHCSDDPAPRWLYKLL